MKPRSLRLILIAGIAVVALGSSLLISSGNASGDRRAASTSTEQIVAPQLADPIDRLVASAARRAE